MNFSTGNSGNTLIQSVVKLGPGCQQEGVFCQYLGKEIAPEIYAIIPNGYVMEALRPAPRTADLLRLIEIQLATHVWNRPELPSSADTYWYESLKKYGVEVPSWLSLTKPCLVHGDPTVSNALMRYGPEFRKLSLVMCDPRAPREYIPQVRETDMGRILQSFYGWEEIAYNAEHIKFDCPKFLYDRELAPKATFWCGAAVARIEYLERSRPSPRRHILDWCLEIRNRCNV